MNAVPGPAMVGVLRNCVWMAILVPSSAPDLVNKLFAGDPTLISPISCGHVPEQRVRDASECSETDPLLRTPSALLLVVLVEAG